MQVRAESLLSVGARQTLLTKVWTHFNRLPSVSNRAAYYIGRDLLPPVQTSFCDLASVESYDPLARAAISDETEAPLSVHTVYD